MVQKLNFVLQRVRKVGEYLLYVGFIFIFIFKKKINGVIQTLDVI